MSSNNIFSKDFETAYATVPFDNISVNDFLPSIKEAIREHNKEIEAITNSSETPNFHNTIEAYEKSGSMLRRIQNVFYNLLEANSTPKMQDIANEISPIESEHSSNLHLNEKLFAKIKAAYESIDCLNLNQEQKRLAKDIYDSFVDNGANLSPEDRTKFRELKKRLSSLCLKFGQNLLNSTNEFKLYITEKELLNGIPNDVTEAFKQKAEGSGKGGYEIDLSYPSYLPVMKYAENRELRKKLYIAYNTKALNGKYDNKEIVRGIANTRLEIAKLLGYENYASYVLKNRMAENQSNVFEFIDNLFDSYITTANNEVKEVKELAQKDNIELMPWDWSFYSNKLKNNKFEFSDEEIRPYLELNNVKGGIFWLANKLYGLTFIKDTNIKVYNEDVEAFKVLDEKDNLKAILYTDYFPRAGKQSGAWMTEFKTQYKDNNGTNHIPHISIVMNFTKPTKEKPSLLTMDELTTFLHEFGHALHGILSNVRYESQAGTNVYRDFVELPSQIMENWAVEEDFLNKFAKHYITGEIIPQKLIEKVKSISNFNVGYQTIRQLSFCYLDMAWHTIKNSVTEDIKTFETEAWKKTILLPTVEDTMMSSQFSHIFDGGYAAGYYGYKWSEVLDADAFSLFKENGIFSKTTAESFKTNILEKGDTEHPMDLYVKFRGRRPNINALLKRNGIL